MYKRQLVAVVAQEQLLQGRGVRDERARLEPVDDAELPAVLAAVARLQPRSLVANPPSLEELFLRHYGDELAALRGGDR